MGGKVQRKDWGNENWASLLQLMANKFSSLALVFVGSADEFDRAAGLAASWPGKTLNLCGALRPRESAAVMKHALLFVGHDSGPMHLASAVGSPCVAMFGNLNKPKWWHPMGKGHRVIHNMQGIHHISPEEVYAAVCSTIAELSSKSVGTKCEGPPEISLPHTNELSNRTMVDRSAPR
jgi:ADP-heptose:LPS heptosyltransferase